MQTDWQVQRKRRSSSAPDMLSSRKRQRANAARWNVIGKHCETRR
jgi:hypothetical protein